MNVPNTKIQVEFTYALNYYRFCWVVVVCPLITLSLTIYIVILIWTIAMSSAPGPASLSGPAETAVWPRKGTFQLAVVARWHSLRDYPFPLGTLDPWGCHLHGPAKNLWEILNNAAPKNTFHFLMFPISLFWEEDICHCLGVKIPRNTAPLPVMALAWGGSNGVMSIDYINGLTFLLLSLCLCLFPCFLFHPFPAALSFPLLCLSSFLPLSSMEASDTFSMLCKAFDSRVGM